MKIELTRKEKEMVLNAINQVKEYTTEWDNLYWKIKEQERKRNKLKKVI
jgi:hypothetical protein